jgi:precorrin isomerase
VPGQLYVCNTGPNATPTPVICPTGVTTVAALKTALNATVVQSVDMQSRLGGVCIAAGGASGKDISRLKAQR